VATVEAGDDAVGAFSRRLRGGGGIEQLLPERGRRYTVYSEAARCRPILLIIACVQLLLTIRHRRGAQRHMLDCHRLPLSPQRGDDAGVPRGTTSVAPGPERGGNRKSSFDRTFGRGALGA
jgi:hypothetical protein